MNVFSIFGEVVIDGIANAEKQLSGMSAKLESVGKQMTNVGKQMTMKVTAPLVAMGAGAFKMAGDFDQAFRRVNVMLGATAEQSKDYKARILEISSATNQAATDVADAFYQIVSAGYRGSDALDILQTAMEGATGGAADAAATTQALTKAMNIFSLEGVEGASRAMDTFFGIVDAGLLSFEEMARSFPMAANMAAGLGVKIEEVGAALATLTKTSGSTEEASTALNATFNALVSPSEAMLGLFEKWGVETGPQAIDKFGGLSGVLKAVQDETGGAVDKLSDLFPNIRSIRAVLPLVTTSADDFAAALETVGGATGRTGEALAEMSEGPGFLWNQMINENKNNLIKLGDTISTTVGPIIMKATQTVTKIVEAFSKLPEPLKVAAIGVAGVAAALGPIVLISGQIVQAIGILGRLTLVTKAVTAAQWLWNAAMTANPIGLLVVAIGGLVAAGVALWRNWDKVVAFFKLAWDKIKGFFVAGVEWIKKVPGIIGDAFTKVKDFILAPFRAAWRGIETGINWLIRQINKLSFDVPDWVPGIGGKHFGLNIKEIELPKFEHGGVVPGAPGEPVPILAHGQEVVLRPGELGEIADAIRDGLASVQIRVVVGGEDVAAIVSREQYRARQLR